MDGHSRVSADLATQRLPILALLLVLLPGTGAAPARADDPCSGFRWDISKERALFGGTPVTLPAGNSSASAPIVAAQRLYELHLKPQTAVAFAVAPGKKITADGMYAGLATLKLAVPGFYRVSVDETAWLDVADKEKLAPVQDYQGQQSCYAPHKIVEFDLTSARRFVLQISGSANATVRVTVTRAPGA